MVGVKGQTKRLMSKEFAVKEPPQHWGCRSRQSCRTLKVNEGVKGQANGTGLEVNAPMGFKPMSKQQKVKGQTQHGD